MAKEEKTEFSTENFYAQFLTIAQDLVTTKVDECGELLMITPKDILKIIHHSVAFGLLASGFHLMLDDKELFSLVVTEYRKIYEDKLSQFIPIQKNDKDE